MTSSKSPRQFLTDGLATKAHEWSPAEVAVVRWAVDTAEEMAEKADQRDEYDLGFLAALESVIVKMALARGWAR